MTGAFAAVLPLLPKRARTICARLSRTPALTLSNCPPKTMSRTRCCISPTCANTALPHGCRDEQNFGFPETGRPVSARYHLHLAHVAVAAADRAAGGGLLRLAALSAQKKHGALWQYGAGTRGQGRRRLAPARSTRAFPGRLDAAAD